MKVIEHGERKVYAFLPEGESKLRLWTHTGADEAEELFRLSGEDIALFAISDCDWNADLSPWPAKACFKGGGDFAGKGPDHLRRLREIVPEVESRASVDTDVPRAIMGYSLAGLFALYALAESDLFACAASVSGSLWYDGFSEYLRAHEAVFADKCVYLSLGDKEAKTRNQRLACIQARTEEARELLEEAGAQVYFELNPGNHFQEPTRRCARAVEWLKAQV